MKNFIAVLMLAMVAGCASLYPAPTAPVCGMPEAAGSIICAIGAKIGQTPEQMHDLLLDASLIGIGTKVTTGQQMKDAVSKVQKWVTEKRILSIQGIVAYLVSEAKIDPALALLLSRRLVFLQVPGLETQALTAFDRGLVDKHLAAQMEQLSFF